MEMKIRVNGVDHPIQAQLIQGTLWVHHNGRVFTVDAATGKKSRKKSGIGGSSDNVIAPMPGKVTKILLSAGATVVAGQAVLVMEAMKMEYTLKAEIAGTIDSIHCVVGEQVALGKSLIKIKPTNDK
ncbi:MAG: acetyl-CoA carboxylase biotin carboxyl carrier protein subunit [Pseudobdellovibrionaceae bacterium]